MVIPVTYNLGQLQMRPKCSLGADGAWKDQAATAPHYFLASVPVIFFSNSHPSLL